MPTKKNLSKKIAVLLNPSSAGGQALKKWPRFNQSLETQGFQVTQYTTTSEADFRVHARAFAKSFRTIGVCGGDSSLTIAAEELRKAKFSGELIFLPAGSVNDIVLDIEEQQAPHSKGLFLGAVTCDGQTKEFLGQTNWGLGVVVNRWVGGILSRMPFLRAFQNSIGVLCILTAHLLRREIVRARIELAHGVLEGEFSILLVSQLRHWASGLRFAPEANWYLPSFEVIAVERTNIFVLMRILLAAKSGGHLKFPQVHYRQTEELSIQFKKAVPAQVDGDILRRNQREIHSKLYALHKNKSKLRLKTVLSE